MRPTENVMTPDEYYNRLLELLAEENGEERNNAMGDVCNQALLAHVALSSEQALDIKGRAAKLFQSGDCSPLLFTVAEVVAPTGIMEPETGFWTPPVTKPTISDEYNTAGYEFRILRESGILSSEERALAADVYMVNIGNNFAGRHTVVYLTDRRLLLVGPMFPPPDFVNEAYRLYYDDWESRPCLDFMDIIWLDKIHSIEYKCGWRRTAIIMQYETKYMKERLHTFFGPYFFKWKLPSTFSVQEGVINVYLTPYTIVPADLKMRMEELVKRVKDAKAALGGVGP